MPKRLLEQRARAFAYLFDAVVVANLEGAITDWNTGAERLHRTEEELARLARYDPIARLASRSLLLDVRRSKESFAVLFIVQDGFQRINDTAGPRTLRPRTRPEPPPPLART